MTMTTMIVITTASLGWVTNFCWDGKLLKAENIQLRTKAR